MTERNAWRDTAFGGRSAGKAHTAPGRRCSKEGSAEESGRKSGGQGRARRGEGKARLEGGVGARDRCLTPSGGIISRTRAMRQDLRHEVNRLGGQHQHYAKRETPGLGLGSRVDGAGLTMRPSRRPTVTRNGRASIVAWFPQTPQPDAHHTHYRIRRLWEVMIVTRLGPGCCRAHPSARLSRVRPRTTRCNFSRHFPPARL